MTQLVSGGLKVRVQPHKLGQRTEDDIVAPSAGRSGVDRRHQHRELPRGGSFWEVCVDEIKTILLATSLAAHTVCDCLETRRLSDIM